MDKLAKALIASLIIAVSFCSSKPKDGNLVEIIENNPPEFSTEYVSNFFRETKETKELLSPVVKINFVLEIQDQKLAIGSGTGFGVLYDRKNHKSYVITNSHICDMRLGATMPSHFYFEDKDTILDQSTNIFSGELFVLKQDSFKDLCLMVTNSYIKPANIAQNYQIHQMERVKIIGAPNGVYPIIIDSYISNMISREVMPGGRDEDRSLLLLSSIIFGGQSGSPIFNRRNEVIGVTFMGLRDEDGPTYGAAAIPLEDLEDFIRESGI